MFPMEASTKHPEEASEQACLTLVRVKGQESRRTKKRAGEGTEPAFCKQNLPAQDMEHFHIGYVDKREECWGNWFVGGQQRHFN